MSIYSPYIKKLNPPIQLFQNETNERDRLRLDQSNLRIHQRHQFRNVGVETTNMKGRLAGLPFFCGRNCVNSPIFHINLPRLQCQVAGIHTKKAFLYALVLTNWNLANSSTSQRQSNRTPHGVCYIQAPSAIAISHCCLRVAYIQH